jgi:hypothetical protein
LDIPESRLKIKSITSNFKSAIVTYSYKYFLTTHRGDEERFTAYNIAFLKHNKRLYGKGKGERKSLPNAKIFYAVNLDDKKAMRDNTTVMIITLLPWV